MWYFKKYIYLFFYSSQSKVFLNFLIENNAMPNFLKIKLMCQNSKLYKDALYLAENAWLLLAYVERDAVNTINQKFRMKIFPQIKLAQSLKIL